MKTTALLFVLIASISFANAQEFNPYFKMDGTLGSAIAFGEFRAGGISVGMEPKVFIRKEWSVGMRISGDIMFGGSFKDGAENISVGLSARGAQTLKTEYYFGETTKRPFVGIGIGRHTMANISADSGGGASISAGNSFGFTPELGISLKNFRFSTIYNIITKKDIINLSAGDTKEISRNYVVFHIGFKVFSFGENQSMQRN